MLFIVLPAIFLFFCENSAGAQCIDISDTPMDIKVQAAPPNIMFVLDNSGSMDWEVMTGESDGKFSPMSGKPSYEYIFDDPGDMSYTAVANDSSDTNGNILSSETRGYYKSQCSGYNKMYYNPQSDYRPWPGMSNADTSNPRSNPANATYTLNLDSTYQSFEEGIIVDNKYSGTNFTTTGYWYESNAYPEYKAYVYFTINFVNQSAGGDDQVWIETIDVTNNYPSVMDVEVTYPDGTPIPDYTPIYSEIGIGAMLTVKIKDGAEQDETYGFSVDIEFTDQPP